MKILLPLLLSLAALSAKPLPSDLVQETAREIDELLTAGQKARDLTPNPPVDDATFLRRSYLNIIGRLPTHDEARVFLSETDETKRTRLIDSLVDSPGFHARLFHFWSDLLRLQTQGESHGLGWHVWLKKAVEADMPYDEMVREMLSADGHTARNPAVGYYLRDRGMLLDNVSNTVQVFLGQQIGCAQCHDHPFDDTTQMEYYQLAAFLGGTEYRFDEGREKIRDVVGFNPDERPATRRTQMKKMTPRERRRFIAKQKAQVGKRRAEARSLGRVLRYHQRNAISENPSRELKLPEDYQYDDGEPGDVVEPGFLFGLETREIAPEKRRPFFANWVTSPQNPYFTKVIANRMWEYAFGYGLVADPDDWANSPDPLFPEVIAFLEQTMLTVEYDLREFLRILYHTDLFQREVTAEAPAQGFSFAFQGPALRRLSAEEIRDSFVTLASGNIDSNTNEALEKSWDDYVASFEYLMNTDRKEFKEISVAVAAAEEKRRQFQRKLAVLRTEAAQARNDGDLAAARKTFQKIREVQRSFGRPYQSDTMMGASESTSKAGAALLRRPRVARSGPSAFRLRASELPVPARGGTFLAEFGASDAESPSAAHTEATVPQILRLLNGRETALLTDRKNAFARTLTKLESAEERLEFLFLSLYSAFPTEAEKESFLPAVATPEATADLARAILTSNRFLFIQ